MAKRTRQILRRIRNVRHVRQITKAMYAIAATQLIQRKRALFSARPFVEESERWLSELWAMAQSEGITHPFISGVDMPGTAIFVVNADRGLCGRYVGDINRAAEELCRTRKNVKLLLGGEKAVRFFRRSPWPIVRSYIRAYERPTVSVAQQIKSDILSLYGREVGEVYVVYMHFRGELSQKLRVEKLLPIPLPKTKPKALLVEPGLPDLLDQALHLHLVGQLFLILLEAKASEQAIRRQAMQEATDNADELLEKLTLQYNKARQYGITSELADIMGGAEALREE